MKTPPRFWAIVLAVTVSILTSASSLQAGIVTFDFESTPATFISPPDSSRPGALTSLSLSNSGLTISISRTSSTHFDIVDNNGNQAGKSASFGNRSLDPFFSPGPNTGFIVNFSSALSAFQLSFGDYGQDAETLTLNAYSGLNGTGTLLGTTTVGYDSAFPTFDTASLTVAGIKSVTWNGTSSAEGFDNSLFYDNLTATVTNRVPDTGTTALLLGLGMVGLVGVRRALGLQEQV